MSNYYLILIWVAIVAFMPMMVNVYKTEYVCGEKVYRYNWMWAFIVFLPLVLWSANRGYVGDMLSLSIL